MKTVTRNWKFEIGNLKLQRGFSIIELLLYMGLFSVLILILVDIFVSILNVQVESESYSTVEQDSRFITSRLLYDLHSAQSILLPSANGSQSATLQLVVNGTNYTYSVANGNLQLFTNNGNDVLNGYDTSVSNLLFKRYGNTGGKPTVQVSFTLTGKVQSKSGQKIKQIQITGSLR